MDKTIKQEDISEALALYAEIHDIVSELMESPDMRIEGLEEADRERLCDLLERVGGLWSAGPSFDEWKAAINEVSRVQATVPFELTNYKRLERGLDDRTRLMQLYEEGRSPREAANQLMRDPFKVTMTVSETVFERLCTLKKAGLHGLSVEDVAERLLCRQLESMLPRG